MVGIRRKKGNKASNSDACSVIIYWFIEYCISLLLGCSSCTFLNFFFLTMKALRTARQAEFAKVAEYIDRSKFLQQVQECKISDEDIRNQQILFSDCKQSLDHIKLALNGGLLTYLLHW